MFENAVLISINTRLSFKLIAKQIYVSSGGEITLIVSHIGPYISCPDITVEYLESLCCDFYFGGKPTKNAIANMLALNHLLAKDGYGDFYYRLRQNLSRQNITIISSELFQ